MRAFISALLLAAGIIGTSTGVSFAADDYVNPNDRKPSQHMLNFPRGEKNLYDAQRRDGG